jgi:hypothetical protein
LSHASSSFFSSYFGDRVLLFAQAILDCDLPILSFPLLLGREAHAQIFLFLLLRWGLATFFLLGLAWNCELLDLSLLHSWDDRCEPLAPGSLFFFFFQCKVFLAKIMLVSSSRSV